MGLYSREVEVRTVLVDASNPRGLAWQVTYYPVGIDGHRWVAVGPMPGRMLFASFGSADGVLSWEDAVQYTRMAWRKMDTAKRNKWYAPKGKYQTTVYPKFSHHPEAA